MSMKRNKWGQLWNGDFYVSIIKSILCGKLKYEVVDAEYHDCNSVKVTIKPEAGGMLLRTIWFPNDDIFDDTERERTMEIAFIDDDNETPEECDNHQKIYVRAGEFYYSQISKREWVRKIFNSNVISKAQNDWLAKHQF